MNVLQAFQTLNLYPNASKSEVKEAYRHLTMKFHPDLTNWDSTAKFQEINEAYEIAYKHASEKKTTSKPPVKTNATKSNAIATRSSESVNKSKDNSNNIGRWLITGIVALILLIMLVPGLQLIVLILLMYGLTRLL